MRALICFWLIVFWMPAGAPRRIVSTAPSITEMLYALGAGGRVVGVTSYCRHPPEAARKPSIGSYLRPDPEAILALGPDLVVVQKNAANLAERLSVLRQNVLELDHDTIPGIYRSLETLGRALGAESKAAAATARIRAELERVRALTAALPRRRVMFVVGRNPGTLQNVIAVGSSSYLNEIIELAGGENVFRSSVGAYPKVSLEEILARNPEVIVDMGEMAQTVGVTEAQKQAVAALWHRYPVLAAARNGRVFAVASDIFVVPGPRVVEAAREFARMLHPEARL